MPFRKPLLALVAAASFAAAALPATQAAATTPVVVTAGGTSPWPVWLLGAGVVSLMARAAYVYRTECRELTREEAFGGVAGPWPLYHQANNKCAPAARAPVMGRY